MKKISTFFFSMFFTGLLVVIFAISIAYATFIENDYGTVTAKILIYNSLWFELLLLVMCVNLVGSIFANKLIQQKRWPGFLLHISFVIIFIGSALTRYVGFEGTMHIRENESSDILVSEPAYITVKAKKGNETAMVEKQVMFSPYTANRFSTSLTIAGQKINIKNKQYMPSAEEKLVSDPAGSPLISVLAVSNQTERHDFVMQPGDLAEINGITMGFEVPGNSAAINFSMKEGLLFVTASDSVSELAMMGQQPVVFAPGESVAVSTQKAYSVGNSSFAVKQYMSKGTTQLVYVPVENNETLNDAIQTEIIVGNTKKTLNVFGLKGEIGKPSTIQIDGIEISVSYGSKNIVIPFSIYLADFQLERYPGSNSPSSYASEVILKDGNTEKPFRIFMNNILKYNGYRFFQSSYDHDEKGTILSVNHDKLGTSVTYFGYLVLALGMVLIFFNKNSRIKSLIKTSAKLRNARNKVIPVILVAMFSGFQVFGANSGYDRKHVDDFGKLLIQSSKGRVEPVNTMASEILRKIARKNNWQGISPTEVFLDMQVNPQKWADVQIIKVANPEFRKMLNASGNFVSYNMLVDANTGNYKLSNLVTSAYEKKANQRNKLDKEVINVDERLNILMSVFSGNFLTIFPVPGDSNHKWINIGESNLLGAEKETFAKSTLTGYLSSVAQGDWTEATTLLNKLRSFQQVEGSKILVSESKINLEIFYNNSNIFGKLSKIFMLLGLVMLVLNLVTIFNPKFSPRKIKKSAIYLIIVLFIVETAGMGIRWYISGHAPWSNGYESMVFISWATCLAGLLFSGRSEITLSLTTLLAGITLLVAGFSWMNPEITPLVPVLKSYWLIVHVAVITSSYGFLGVGALLGMLNLILMILRRKENAIRVNLTIKELVNVIDITLLIGLILLTLGSFLGGVWANESWGRYWGWDPKETWALVTILVYTFISHMHKIPGFKGEYALSAASLLGFSSVLMTYFGVNYYLSGMHSYAQGDPAPIPSGVYIAVVAVLIMTIWAFFADKNQKQLSPSKK